MHMVVMWDPSIRLWVLPKMFPKLLEPVESDLLDQYNNIISQTSFAVLPSISLTNLKDP